MISAFLTNTVARFAREFNVGSVWLFGSALENESSAQDIDLAVEGDRAGAFF